MSGLRGDIHEQDSKQVFLGWTCCRVPVPQTMTPTIVCLDAVQYSVAATINNSHPPPSATLLLTEHWRIATSMEGKYNSYSKEEHLHLLRVACLAG